MEPHTVQMFLKQSCQLTTVNNCDSVAVFNLTITQSDTSFTEITACESFEWNGETYSANYHIQPLKVSIITSMSFDGDNDDICQRFINSGFAQFPIT